jgi:chaperonin GroES
MNLSGYWPLGYRILVKPDPVEKQTKGGIVIPDLQREAYDRAQITGTVVAIGPDAWYDCNRPWAKIGQRVSYARYGGQLIAGKDGCDYRLLNDKDVTCAVDADVVSSEILSHETRQRYAG